MELNRIYKEDELSSIQFSCEEEAVGEVWNLFFSEQLSEEQILLELYSPNDGSFTALNQNMLDLDKVFSKKELSKKCRFRKCKIIDSSRHQKEFSVETILSIKKEQRKLKVTFKGLYILVSRNALSNSKDEPLLFAAIDKNIFYLLNSHILNGPPSNLSFAKNIKNWIQKRTFLKMFSKLSNLFHSEK